jgi:serine/threonine-protein kinase RsbW
VADAKRVSLSIPRDTRYLSLVRQSVVVLARRVGFSSAATGEIEMAVDEAASNAIRHARGVGAISLEAVGDGSGLTVTVVDGGQPFSFDRCGAGDVDAYHAQKTVPGGLGVFIIKRFMDEVSYTHTPETGNELRMRKYLCPTSTS